MQCFHAEKCSHEKDMTTDDRTADDKSKGIFPVNANVLITVAHIAVDQGRSAFSGKQMKEHHDHRIKMTILLFILY